MKYFTIKNNFLVFISSLLLFVGIGCTNNNDHRKKFLPPGHSQNIPSLGYFTIGVATQSPIRIRNGKNNAQNYKEIGINTFVGLWQWPDEVGMGQGYNILAAQALKDNGLKAYAGNNQSAVDWINKHPEFADTFIGYILGDEPDMNKVHGNPEYAKTCQPDTWKANGDALRAADPTRHLFACMGKGFALDPWPGYHLTTTQAEDFEKYVSPLTIAAADYYGITDPWEVLSAHGIWTYGKTVSNVKKYAGTRPVWGVVEVSAPFPSTDGNPANQMYISMPPNLIKTVVWNMIAHGATGIIYFCHNFYNGMIEDGCLAEPGMPEAMKAVNESINNYAAILLTRDVSGTTQVNDGQVPVTILTKTYHGTKYIFAMGDGNATYRNGQAVNATITIAGATGIVTVNVDGEGRNITMTNGKFSDHFEPYELHIYKITQ